MTVAFCCFLFVYSYEGWLDESQLAYLIKDCILNFKANTNSLPGIFFWVSEKHLSISEAELKPSAILCHCFYPVKGSTLLTSLFLTILFIQCFSHDLWWLHCICWTFMLLSICTESESGSAVSDSFQTHGLYSPWNSPGQNTGVGSLSLLQGVFPTQGSKPALPHCRWTL